MAAGDAAALSGPAHHALHSMGRASAGSSLPQNMLAQAGCGNPAAAYSLKAAAHPGQHHLIGQLAATFDSNKAQASSSYVGPLDMPLARSAQRSRLPQTRAPTPNPLQAERRSCQQQRCKVATVWRQGRHCQQAARQEGQEPAAAAAAGARQPVQQGQGPQEWRHREAAHHGGQ